MRTHQTVRLGPGRHADPAAGTCVMELASMLAGERFSDDPESVCPVIAAVLRAYNDGVEDDRRQDLYRVAAMAVGTRSPGRAQRLRARRAMRWAMERRFDAGSTAGRVAVRLVADGHPRAHADALQFVEQLMAQGDRAPAEAGGPPRGRGARRTGEDAYGGRASATRSSVRRQEHVPAVAGLTLYCSSKARTLAGRGEHGMTGCD